MMIYHFTKLSSLFGILDSQELFLGNCNQMNDPLDRTFGIDCLRSYVRNGGKYAKKLKGTLSDADIENALKMSLKRPYYAVSFSKDINNSTLWENYADNYKGVAIGFDERQLESAIDDIIQYLDNEGFTQKSFLELKMITYGYRYDVIDSLVENYNDNSVNEKIHLAFIAYKLCGMISEWIVDKPATCEEAGIRHKECTVCHEVMETGTISATGHAWGEWTETKAPTYTEEGEETRICSACGETDIRPVVALGLIQKFKDEVASVGKAQSRSEQFDAISASLTTYDSLSEEEKVAVANDYESLVVAIEAYNASAEAANAELNGATEIAIKVLSSAVTIAAVLAGVWFVLKRLF